MTKKLFRNQAAKVKTGFWWLSQGDNLEKLIFYLILLFLPTQFGRHFWPTFSYVYGIRVDYLSPTIYVTDILILFLFITIFFKKLKLKLSKTYLLFILYLFLTLLLSKYWQVGVYGFIKFLELSFFAICCSFLSLRKERIITLLTIPYLFEAFLSIGQFLNKGSIGSFFYFLGERSFNGQTPSVANALINGSLILRPYGTFSHPNVLAAFLLLVFTLIIFSQRRLSILYFISLAIGAVAIFLTLSRVVILLLAIITIARFYFFIKEKKNKFPQLIFGIIILITFFYFIFLSPFSSRFLALSLGDLSVVQRGELISASFRMFLKSPLFGLGINSFLPNLPRFINQQYSFFIQPVHNIYLLVLSELGIFGFAFFILLLVRSFRKIIRLKNYLVGLLLIEVLILGFFDHYFLTLQQGQLLLALVIGLSFSKPKLGIE